MLLESLKLSEVPYAQTNLPTQETSARPSARFSIPLAYPRRTPCHRPPPRKGPPPFNPLAMLPAVHRLRSRRDFERVYRMGHRLSGRMLSLRVAPHQNGPTRVGFVVSTKISKAATVRNRLKRQLRHLVRDLLPTLPPHRDIIVSYHGPAAPAPGALKRAVTNALEATRTH
jgi:ribonuclease P protein component